jgi:hypothetical protein
VPDEPERLSSPRWLGRHALAIGLAAAFLALGWWQLQRAAQGNALSIGYMFEWPVFAAFVVFIWVREIRRARRSMAGPTEPESAAGGLDGAALNGAGSAAREAEPAESGAPRRRPVVARLAPGHPAYDDSDDEQLARYNAYLHWLSENPDAKPSDYRVKGN